MTGLEAFLDQYGLAAIFLIMLTKSAGIPVPVPADFIMLATAARAAGRKLALWQEATCPVCLVLGGTHGRL